MGAIRVPELYISIKTYYSYNDRSIKSMRLLKISEKIDSDDNAE